MALVVESTSTATVSNSTSVTVTKPTGVASGDLLLIATHKTADSTDATCSGFTLATSNWYNASGGLPDVGNTLLYRIADASDVSAANYTVNHSSSQDSGTVAMFRVSGWVTGNPVFATAVASASQDAASYTLTASGLSITRQTDSALLLLLSSFHSNNSPYSTSTSSGYSVTSGVANPTWTEVCDSTITMYGGLDNCSFACAYATTTNQTDITAFSIDGATDTGGTEDSETALLVVILEPKGFTGTNATLTVSPTIFTNTAVEVGNVGTNATFAISPNLPTQSGEALQPTPWTTVTKS